MPDRAGGCRPTELGHAFVGHLHGDRPSLSHPRRRLDHTDGIVIY